MEERRRKQQDERLILALADPTRRRRAHLLQELLTEDAVQEGQLGELALGEERLGIGGVTRPEKGAQIGRAIRLLRLLQDARRQRVRERLLQDPLLVHVGTELERL